MYLAVMVLDTAAQLMPQCQRICLGPVQLPGSFIGGSLGNSCTLLRTLQHIIVRTCTSWRRTWASIKRTFFIISHRLFCSEMMCPITPS